MGPSYSDSFGSFSSGGVGVGGSGVNGGVIASEDSAIVTPSGGRRKRWPVVILVVMVLAAIGALVAMMVIPRGGGGSFREDFLKFANYTINGNAVDQEIEADYDATKSYYFMSHQGTEEEQAALYSETNKLLVEAVASYESIKGDKPYGDNTNIISNLIGNEAQMFEFMKVVYTKPILTEADLISYFNENGKDAAVSYADGYYDLESLSENQYATDFSENYAFWVENEVALIALYRGNSCLGDDYLDVVCMLEKDEEMQSKAKEYSQNVQDVSGSMKYYYNLSDSFVYNVFLINKLVNGAMNEE